jgi:hypothetical protein
MPTTQKMQRACSPYLFRSSDRPQPNSSQEEDKEKYNGCHSIGQAAVGQPLDFLGGWMALEQTYVMVPFIIGNRYAI